MSKENKIFYGDSSNTEFRIYQTPPNKWQMTINGLDMHHFLFPTAPNWFFRLMQRIVLGFKWERINEDT